MSSLGMADKVAIALVLLALAGQLFFQSARRRAPYSKLRKVNAYQSADLLISAVAEKGRRLVLGIGNNLPDQGASLSGVAGLPLLKAISRRSLFNDQKLQTVSGDGVLACLSQMVTHGTYQNAVAVELFQPGEAVLAGTTRFASLAGLLPEVNHRANGGVILSGQFEGETLLALDLAARKNILVAGSTASLGGQAAFLAGVCNLALGEDYYAPAASLETDPAAAASLRAQDLLRIIIAIALLVGAGLTIAGVL